MTRKFGNFTEEYKRNIFSIWYSKGKPEPIRLYNAIPDVIDGTQKPSKATLFAWIRNDFKQMALILDEQVTKEMEARLIQDKIAMLTRHADLGQRMQDMGFGYLEDNRGELNAHAAVRLVVEGWKIERESRGMPALLQEIMDASDEELLEEVKRLTANTKPIIDGEFSDG